MKRSDLNFDYPDSLIATSKGKVSRVMVVDSDGVPAETTINGLISTIQPEDLLVINTTKVIKARVICPSGLEVLFIQETEPGIWEVLCPSRKWSSSGETLPCGVPMELVQKGLPQKVKVHRELNSEYFLKHGDLPLPPYIQQARGQRGSLLEDEQEYQTDWAKQEGSLAAPTASLHFNQSHLDAIMARGAQVEELCLHVGLGTFLPVHADDLEDHKMHSEWVQIPVITWEAIEKVKSTGGRIWALGTTVTRALEAQAQGHFELQGEAYEGGTDIFITPGFEYQVVDVLMTNFHQPESTLMALVGGFSGLDKVKASYGWAIDKEFRLFSYGDLSVWHK